MISTAELSSSVNFLTFSKDYSRGCGQSLWSKEKVESKRKVEIDQLRENQFKVESKTDNASCVLAVAFV